MNAVNVPVLEAQGTGIAVVSPAKAPGEVLWLREYRQLCELPHGSRMCLLPRGLRQR